MGATNYCYSITVTDLDTDRTLWSQNAETLDEAHRIAVRALTASTGCRFLMVVKLDAPDNDEAIVMVDGVVRPEHSRAKALRMARRCTVGVREWGTPTAT